MKNIFLLLLLILLFSCKSRSKSDNSGNLDLTSNNNFNNFIGNFTNKTLPFELSVINDLHDFDFSKVISLDDATTFLYKGNRSCISIPTGGYYNFYYSNLISTESKKFILLTYYRVGEETDYIMNSYDYSGNFKDSLIIAGQVGDSIQKEVFISKHVEIQVTKIKIISPIENLTFHAQREISDYFITEDGIFKKKSVFIDTSLYKFDNETYKFIKQ
jgi:hypothetical protein